MPIANKCAETSLSKKGGQILKKTIFIKTFLILVLLIALSGSIFNSWETDAQYSSYVKMVSNDRLFYQILFSFAALYLSAGVWIDLRMLLVPVSIGAKGISGPDLIGMGVPWKEIDRLLISKRKKFYPVSFLMRNKRFVLLGGIMFKSKVYSPKLSLYKDTGSIISIIEEIAINECIKTTYQ